MKIEFPPEARNPVIIISWRAYESYDLSQMWAISIIQDGFHGENTCWFDESQMTAFLAQLQRCEYERRGEASLEAMSPNDFKLRIFNTHDKGDFALSYEIATQSVKLSGSFAFDPSFLPRMVADFKELVSWPSENA